MNYNQNINPYAPYTPSQTTAVPNMQQPQNNMYVPQNKGMMDYVADENAARNYPIGPNSRILLMDQFNNVFYIKTTDTFGNISSFRVFSYVEGGMNTQTYAAPVQQEVTSTPVAQPTSNAAPVTQDNNSPFITKDEFNARMDELLSFFDEKTKPDKEVTKLKEYVR